MPQQLIQSSFQFGEISPLLHAQVNSPIYYKAAKRLRNVLVIPQGGVERRFGLHYRATVSGITDYRLIKPFIFDYEDGTRYLLIFRNLALDIYFNNAIVATVVTTYTSTQIEALSIAQTSNLLFIAHGSYKPGILRRTSAHAGWTLVSDPTFYAYPTFDFDQGYSSLYFRIRKSGLTTEITTSDNILGNTVDIWSFANDTIPGSGVTANLFTANHVGALFFANSGVLRITGVPDQFRATARILAVFSASSSIFLAPKFLAAGTDTVLTEVAFSATRGWPQKVAFFQNRLFFARSSSLLGGIFGSNYNGFKYNGFLFDDSEALDTNAISTVLHSKKAVLIEHLVSHKSLLVMTTSGLYSTPLLAETPLTPSNIDFINLQTADSSTSVPEPAVFDNDVILFDKGGKKVKSITIDGASPRYQTNSISVLAPHLIDQPYSSAVFENSSERDGSWLFVVNNGDTLNGDLSIYQNVPEQEITAWTLSTTDGKFRHVVADEDTVYFIVERVIGGVTKLFIEQLDFDLKTDATLVATYGSPTATITGLTYLEGEVVRVVGDGSVMESRTVSGGQIVLERTVSEVKVGLNFDPEIVPMPLNIPTQVGANVYLPKSIKRAFVDFYESSGIKVDGELIPPFRFGVDQYNDPLTPKTDFAEVCPFAGWDPRQEISITQTDPLPMTIIGIGFEVTT